MEVRTTHILAGTLTACLASCGAADRCEAPADAAPELGVVSVEIASDRAVAIDFDRPVDRGTVDTSTMQAFGRWSGAIDGPFSFSRGDCTVTVERGRGISAGDRVGVTLANELRGADGSSLRAAGYADLLWVPAGAADMNFVPAATLTTRTDPDEPAIAYGGLATDLDDDGWLDLTIVNEYTADLRIFKNPADGSLNFPAFEQPTTAVGAHASPSESADFDDDGQVDLCVANIHGDSVSVLRGRGDGTFFPAQTITVGDAPRGIAVLDVDGDGDLDIVNTNRGSDELSLLINEEGVFGDPEFFDAGVVDEWAVAAADMDGDHVADLVVGGNLSRDVVILLGDGDGGFEAGTPYGDAGRVRMIDLGDVDGDGDLDVSVARGGVGGGAILLNEGEGRLAPPVDYPGEGIAIATDLGDLDGDGDPDWVLSVLAGSFELYENEGDGDFVLERVFPATESGSCALAFDGDNDGDLDLALVDELADEVTIMENG